MNHLRQERGRDHHLYPMHMANPMRVYPYVNVAPGENMHTTLFNCIFTFLMVKHTYYS